MNFLLRRQLHVISIKFSQILTVHPPLWLMKWRGFDTSLWEPLWFTNCTSCSQRLRTGSTPWAWLCFLSSVSHSQGTSAEQPMDHQTQLATGQKSSKQVLADNRSLLYFGLPQAVTFQKSSSAVCQRMQYASIHSTRDQDGREGKQQPLCERCSGLQGHFCPCFWRLSRNCGIDERVCSLERFVKVLSSEPFPTVCFHRKQLGKTSEKELGAEHQGLDRDGVVQPMGFQLWLKMSNGDVLPVAVMRTLVHNLGAPQLSTSLPQQEQQQKTAVGRGSTSGAARHASWSSSA